MPRKPTEAGRQVPCLLGLTAREMAEQFRSGVASEVAAHRQPRGLRLPACSISRASATLHLFLECQQGRNSTEHRCSRRGSPTVSARSWANCRQPPDHCLVPPRHARRIWTLP